MDHPAAVPIAPARPSPQGWLRNRLTVPVIYGMAGPLLLLDVAISLYQWTCFPLYRIATVRRRDHFVMDRARLPYLDRVGKLNCAYCSYANGLLAYSREIAARTEQYWCPIKHARAPADAHARYAAFADYGDAEGFASRTAALRRSLATEAPGVEAPDTARPERPASDIAAPGPRD